MYDDALIVIPARGGSKGIEHKNVRLVGTLPLVVYSIIAALDSGVSPDNILVSSNDPDVLKIAESWGVVPFVRPDELCTDTSPTEEALRHALMARLNCNYIVTLQPTSPLRRRGLVADCIDAFKSGPYDSLLTVTKYAPFFWQEHKSEKTDGYVWVSTYDPKSRPMRQQIPKEQLMYFDNGSVYITAGETLWRTRCRLGSSVLCYALTDFEGMQIDDESDLQLFSALFTGIREEGLNEWTDSYTPTELFEFLK